MLSVRHPSAFNSIVTVGVAKLDKSSNCRAPSSAFTSQSFFSSFFIFDRAESTQGRVSSLRIVEAFDLIKDISPGFVSCPAATAADAVAFHPREEAFHHRVVVALPRPAHAAFDAVVREQPLELLSRTLAALVTVISWRAGN